MPTLKVFIDEKENNLEYSYSITKGMYFVKDTDLAIKNCKTFNIQLSQPVEEKITRLKDFAIITTKAVDDYVQCIIFKSVDKNELYEFASNMPEPAKNNIISAYKLLTLSFRLG